MVAFDFNSATTANVWICSVRALSGTMCSDALPEPNTIDEVISIHCKQRLRLNENDTYY